MPERSNVSTAALEMEKAWLKDFSQDYVLESGCKVVVVREHYTMWAMWKWNRRRPGDESDGPA
jgi:hypothetical protein